MTKNRSAKKFYVVHGQLTTRVPSLFRERSMNELRRLAKRVLSAHPPSRVPRIVSGRGDGGLRGYGLASYTLGHPDNLIVLARTHRNVGVLLHELAHVLEPKADHGPRFRDRYYQLLADFGGVPFGEVWGKAL